MKDTEPQNGPQSQYADSILSSLRRMSRALDLYSRVLKKDHGLTGPQLVCLRDLLRESPTTPGSLAANVALSQATVTGILDRLELRGLITRTRDSRDKRVVNIELTEAGRDVAELAPSALHRGLAEQLVALPDGEQALIDWVLRRVVDMMESQVE